MVLNTCPQISGPAPTPGLAPKDHPGLQILSAMTINDFESIIKIDHDADTVRIEAYTLFDLVSALSDILKNKGVDVDEMLRSIEDIADTVKSIACNMDLLATAYHNYAIGYPTIDDVIRVVNITKDLKGWIESVKKTMERADSIDRQIKKLLPHPEDDDEEEEEEKAPLETRLLELAHDITDIILMRLSSVKFDLSKLAERLAKTQ